MPKHEVWPYDAELITNKGATFEERTLTISESSKIESFDGISSATGKPFHFPPRIVFVEDPTATEWQWKVWEKDGKKVDKPVDPSPEIYPAFGERVKAKLKIAEKDNGEYFYDIVRLTPTGEGVPPDIEPASQEEIARRVKRVAEGIEPDEEQDEMDLGKLSITEVVPDRQEVISATAGSNVVAVTALSSLSDDDPRKMVIIEANLLMLEAQISPRIYGIATKRVQQKLRDSVSSDDLTDKKGTGEDVEELPW